MNDKPDFDQFPHDSAPHSTGAEATGRLSQHFTETGSDHHKEFSLFMDGNYIGGIDYEEYCPDGEHGASIARLIVDAVNERDDLKAKLEKPMKCNSGHERWPLKLWDCPDCTEIIRKERDSLKETISTLTRDLDLARKAEADLRSRLTALSGAVEKCRTFIQYARYELDPGKGNQFPGQTDADEHIAMIDALLPPARQATEEGGTK